MKKILTLFLALVACLSLASCSKKYVTDVEASVISKALEEGITTDFWEDIAALRMRVSISEIGSCILIVAPLTSWP